MQRGETSKCTLGGKAKQDILKVGQAGFNKTFTKWLDNTDYRERIATGKGKLEWDRKVPDEKIANLKDLLNCDSFNDNLPDVSI